MMTRLRYLISIIAVLFAAVAVWALDGMVLFTSNAPFNQGDLKLKYLSTGNVITLEKGGAFGASFSPDGKSVAFSKNANQITTMSIAGEGRNVVTGCGGGNVQVTVTWVGADNLYWSQNDKHLYKIKTNGSGKATVFTYSKNIHNAGVSQDGKRAAWTSPSWVLGLGDLSTGKGWEKGGGCQGSISPDGKYYTHNQESHKDCIIGKFDGGTLKTIHPPTGTFNAHRWSHKSNDHVLYTLEKSNKCYVHDITTNNTVEVATGFIWDYFPSEVSANPVSAMPQKALVINQTAPVRSAQPLSLFSANGRRIFHHALHIAPQIIIEHRAKGTMRLHGAGTRD